MPWESITMGRSSPLVSHRLLVSHHLFLNQKPAQCSWLALDCWALSRAAARLSERSQILSSQRGPTSNLWLFGSSAVESLFLGTNGMDRLSESRLSTLGLQEACDETVK